MTEYAAWFNQSAKMRVETNINEYVRDTVLAILDFIEEQKELEAGIKLVRLIYSDHRAAAQMIVRDLEANAASDREESMDFLWFYHAFPSRLLWSDEMPDYDDGALHGTFERIIEGFEDRPGDRIAIGEAIGVLDDDGRITPTDRKVWIDVFGDLAQKTAAPPPSAQKEE